MFWQIIKWAGYILGGILLLACICLQVYKSYLRNSTTIKTPNGISSLEEIILGDLKQWIFIRSIDQHNPVLIFLHGGPGEPAMGMSSARHLDAELINHFTVVHWDQRGAGKSYNKNIPIHSMTLDRLVEDCSELIDSLRARFFQEKVFLVGHSAGTTIGIRTAYKYPEKIHAYVGVAQIIDDHEQQKLSYNLIVEKIEKSGDKKNQLAIKTIGPPRYDSPEKEFKKAGYIVHHGGFIHDSPYKQIAILTLSYLTSPEYSFSEGIRTANRKGLNFTMNARWEELKNNNFTKEIQSIKVPIYFIAGKYDMIIPQVQFEKKKNGMDAEIGVNLIIFEHSAHLPIIEENEKYTDFLVNVVLKESLAK